MRISSDILQSVIGNASGRAENNARDKHDTRRRNRRIQLSKRATLARLGSAVCIPLTITDFASEGVGFVFLTPLNRAEQFVLRVNEKCDDSLTVQCGVAWCQKTGGSRFRIGAEFMRMIDQTSQPLRDNNSSTSLPHRSE